MSITHRMTEMTENPFGLSASRHRCFHCGEFLKNHVMTHNEIRKLATGSGPTTDGEDVSFPVTR